MMKIISRKKKTANPAHLLTIEKVLKLSGIKELNPVQKEAVDNGLLSEKNMVIASPTASGKTLMAELAMYKALEEKKKIVYLAPLIALASEKYESFKKKYEPLGYKIALSVGDFDSTDPWLRDYDIIVCSNEKMDSLLRHGVDWANRIGLVIADEVHLISEPSRGPTLEIVLTKLRELSNARFILLSATIKNAEDMADWLNGEIIFSEWRPVKLYEGIAFEGAIDFEGRTDVLGSGTIENEIAKKTLESGKQAMFFVAARRFTESLAVQIGEEIDEMLAEEDKIELAKMAKEIENVLERPTEQCIKLGNCIRKGVSFHHAGLIGKQKSLIEEGFRKGKIKFITATPTLAMGVSLPAFRVVIRDTKRYYPRLGSVYIPVMEYKQMAGRAGRPEWDTHGEAIIVAKNRKEASEFRSHYINGDTEEIYSKLAVEPVLRTHILALIASGMCPTKKSLEKFFSKTFYSFQYGDSHGINKKISEMLRKLTDWKMISGFMKEDQGFFQSADSIADNDCKLEPTRLGKRVSELYIDPKTAWELVEKMKNEADPEIMTFLNLISHTLELKPGLSVRTGEYDLIAEELEKNKDKLLGKVPSEWDEEFDEFLGSFKVALALGAWANENDEEEIMQNFGVSPGELRARLELADWLLYASSEIAALQNKGEIVLGLKKTRTRLKYGVKEELLPLVKLRNIGRARARKLYAAGIRNATAIKNASPEKLKELLGDKVSKNLKELVKDE